MVPYQALCVGLWCWHIGHSAMTEAGLCWWMEVSITLGSWAPCEMTQVSRERGLVISTGWVILPTWLLKSSSTENTILWMFIWDASIFTFFQEFREINLYTPSQDFFVTNFPIIPFKSLAIQPSHWPQPMNEYISAYLVLFSSKLNEQSSAWLKVLLNGRGSLSHCPSGMSQEGAVVL